MSSNIKVQINSSIEYTTLVILEQIVKDQYGGNRSRLVQEAIEEKIKTLTNQNQNQKLNKGKKK
jgi:metal-responsive CopG/Arc/MetJ family transcriptional regulator